MPLSRRMTTSNILRIFTLMIEGKIFEKEVMSQTDMDDKYLGCTFESCNMNGMTIQDTDFQHCEFRGCNLSMMTRYSPHFKY